MVVAEVAAGQPWNEPQLRLIPDPSPLVLYVRDAAAPPTALGACLRTWGFRVVERVGAEAGLEWARAIKPDVVLVESTSSTRDGLVRRLAQDAATRACPVFQLEAVPATAGPMLHVSSGAILLSSACVPDQWLSALVHLLAQPSDCPATTAHRRRLLSRLPVLPMPTLRPRKDRRSKER